MRNGQKTYLTIVLTVVMTLLPALSASASDEHTAPADTIVYGNYSYIRYLSENESVTISDEEFNDIAGKVVFPVSKFTLPKKSALIHELETEVLPMLKRNQLEVVCIMMRGTASPEGPYRFNKYLGEQRSKALVDFLKKHLGNETDMTVKLEVEDYQRLCQLMKEADDPAYKEVKALCDKYLEAGNPHKLKRELVRKKHGRLWTRLKRQYFPELRTASVVFFLRKKQEQPADPVSKQQQETERDTDTDIKPIETDSASVGREGCTPPPEPDSVWVCTPRRELLAIKTNLLFDLAYMPGYNGWCPIPNVALEYYPKGGHFTFGASIDFPWWKNYWKHKYFEVRNYQLEARYYMRPGDAPTAAFKGFYVQAYANAGLFCLCFDADRGWIGEGFGGGVGFGYVLPLSKNGHWRLELSAQVGFFTCKYDPFQFEYRGFELNDHLYYYDWVQPANQFKQRQYRFNWLGPTRIGVTLSYDILYRRKAKKGISFKAYEQTYEPYMPSTAQEAHKSHDTLVSEPAQHDRTPLPTAPIIIDEERRLAQW
ncbi:MAG: DUF3575 domain-containing protein [Prevotella sp.]|nr:DUF3575 domain-containing protein [Prevotella sp.]